MGASPALKRGAVVLVRFRSTRGLFVLRPAINMAVLGGGDHLLMQITAKPYGDRRAIGLPERCFRRGSLQTLSFARPGRLFTANEQVIERTVATLTDGTMASLIETLLEIVRTK